MEKINGMGKGKNISHFKSRYSGEQNLGNSSTSMRRIQSWASSWKVGSDVQESVNCSGNQFLHLSNKRLN